MSQKSTFVTFIIKKKQYVYQRDTPTSPSLKGKSLLLTICPSLPRLIPPLNKINPTCMYLIDSIDQGFHIIFLKKFVEHMSIFGGH